MWLPQSLNKAIRSGHILDTHTGDIYLSICDMARALKVSPGTAAKVAGNARGGQRYLRVLTPDKALLASISKRWPWIDLGQ